MREGIDRLYELLIPPQCHFIDEDGENDGEREPEDQLDQRDHEGVLRGDPEIILREHPLEMRPAVRLAGCQVAVKRLRAERRHELLPRKGDARERKIPEDNNDRKTGEQHEEIDPFISPDPLHKSFPAFCFFLFDQALNILCSHILLSFHPERPCVFPGLGKLGKLTFGLITI